MRVKGWNNFQHYKKRRPPWIRVYRELLDDPDFHALSGDAVKHLMLMWLVASEDKDLQGGLPDENTLAFRLRTTASKLQRSFSELGKWLEQDDSEVLADCKQHATPETETETETDQSQNARARSVVGFDSFWSAYPKKVGKAEAKRKYASAAKTEDWPGHDAVAKAVESQSSSPQWTKDGGQFVPNPATWLNQGRYLDEAQQQRDMYDNSFQRKLEAAAALEREEAIDVECKRLS